MIQTLSLADSAEASADTSQESMSEGSCSMVASYIQKFCLYQKLVLRLMMRSPEEVSTE